VGGFLCLEAEQQVTTTFAAVTNRQGNQNAQDM